MKLDQILNTYVSQIPRIPTLGDSFTAEQLYEYYRTSSTVEDIEPFVSSRSNRLALKFSVQEQVDSWRFQLKEFSRLGQLLFEAKNKGK